MNVLYENLFHMAFVVRFFVEQTRAYIRSIYILQCVAETSPRLISMVTVVFGTLILLLQLQLLLRNHKLSYQCFISRFH